MTIAQKILSCVARVKENFGVKHVITVLRGEATDKVRQRGHDQLTTFGLLREHDDKQLRDWVYQLISQGVLVQAGDEYPILKLNDASWEVMKGQRSVRLMQRVQREAPKKSKADMISWEGVDRALFEALRDLRKRLAEERSVPPYVIFSDATLREMARMRPSTLEKLRLVYGVGEAKLRDFGARFQQVIEQHCRERKLSTDQTSRPAASVELPRGPVKMNPGRELAYRLFRDGADVTDVCHQTGRARSTVMEYLAEFIREARPQSIAAWVSAELYEQIATVAGRVGMERLRPIFLELGEKVGYDEIRLVVAHLQSRESTGR